VPSILCQEDGARTLASVLFLKEVAYLTRALRPPLSPPRLLSLVRCHHRESRLSTLGPCLALPGGCASRRAGKRVLADVFANSSADRVRRREQLSVLAALRPLRVPRLSNSFRKVLY